MPNTPCVLVVDDDEQVRRLIEQELNKEKLRVVTASSGREAWHILQAERTVDAIILDLEMPVMDGEALAKAVRADSRYAHIPVLMISGNNDLERADKSPDVTALLHKPFPLAVLVATVRRLLLP